MSYMERRARRYASQGKVESGFRVLDGQQDGIGQRWRHGLATIDQGKIVFVPYLGSVRFLRRAQVQIPIASVDRSVERQPKSTEIFGVNPRTKIVRLTTPTATLEWAITADMVQWATRRAAGWEDTPIQE